jgi:EAL domain-containing protein (putative c-di-GMP-specific phosphodiesterase class I)/PAS domain-containing protein
MLNIATIPSSLRSTEINRPNRKLSRQLANARLADRSILNEPEHAVFYICDDRGKIVHGNRAFAALEAEIAGERDPWTLSFPLDPEALRAIIDQINEWQVPVVREEAMTIHGEFRRFRSIHLGLYGQDNKLTGVAGIYQDVCDHSRPGANYSRLRDRFDDVTQLASDWIWETDAGLRLEYVSPQVTGSLGFLPRDLEGIGLLDFGSFDVDTCEQDFDRNVPFRDVPYRVRDRDGYVRLFLLSGLPYYCPNAGTFLGLRGTAREIDEPRLVSGDHNRNGVLNGRRDFALERDLRRAVDRDEIHLCYHPLVDLTTGEVSGVETLLRWVHPQRGQVPPDQFIPVAEATGVIADLGEWVMEAACRQAKTWQDAGLPPMRIGINLSPVQFRRSDLAKTVRRVLGETGLDPRWLEFEITEGMIMDQADTVVETLKSLRAIGVDLAIDDFGTGYSSLAYLQRFPVNRLKIDRSFIEDICSNSDNAAITRAIITLSHDLGMTVVAEGVETKAQFDHLSEVHCEEAQGFYFTRPLVAEDMGKWLAGRSTGA